MNALELKIPPPLVALLCALAMWGAASVTPTLAVLADTRLAMVILVVALGGAFDIAGLIAFRRARTTINPLKPSNTAALVTGGIYGYTRNPMYVGMALFLLAWTVWLAAPWAVLGVAAFVAYITRFQIQPEERVLVGLFGARYADYTGRVRRWL